MRASSFQEFIEEYSPRVSDEGILLPTEQALPQGAPVEFEISLSDDFRVLRGVGEVAWFVPPEEAAAKSGLALRFTQLEAPSRRLIHRLVERYRSEGGTLFSLVRWPDSVRPPEVEAGEPAVISTPGSLGPAVEEVGPEILLSQPAEGPVEITPTRPSRTPVGEDSVLIPAPALDGEPLPSDRESSGEWVAEESDAWVEPPEPSSGAMEGEPADTLELPPVEPLSIPSSDLGRASADLGMETLRVDDLQPSSPVAAEPAAAEFHRPPPPLAGVGRADSGGGRSRLWALLMVLALVVAAVWVLRSDVAAPLWNRLVGGSSAVTASPANATDPEEVPPAAAGRAPGAAETASSLAASEAPVENGPTGAALTEAGGTEAGGTEAQAAVSPPPADTVPQPPAAVARAPLPPLSRVLAVESERRGEVTEVRLLADGPFTEAVYNGTRVLGGAPRILIRVLGVSEPFREGTIAIGTPEVERIRVGLHRTGSRLDLHFVADLTSDAVRLVSAEARGSSLYLGFAR